MEGIYDRVQGGVIDIGQGEAPALAARVTVTLDVVTRETAMAAPTVWTHPGLRLMAAPLIEEQSWHQMQQRRQYVMARQRSAGSENHRGDQ